MSTYWYLECLDHDPILGSDDEVEQHTHGLPNIDALVARRDEIAAYPDDVREAFRDSLSTFERSAYRFINQHPKCRLRYVNEYGNYRPVLTPKETR